MNRLMDRCKDRCLNGQTYGQMREQTDKCINAWLGRKKDVCAYGWIDGFIGRWESKWGRQAEKLDE